MLADIEHNVGERNHISLIKMGTLVFIHSLNLNFVLSSLPFFDLDFIQQAESVSLIKKSLILPTYLHLSQAMVIRIFFEAEAPGLLLFELIFRYK